MTELGHTWATISGSDFRTDAGFYSVLDRLDETQPNGAVRDLDPGTIDASFNFAT